MPSPRSFRVRKRIRTPDPRLLSDGRCRSPSPPLVEDEEPIARCRSPSSPLVEDEEPIAQIIMMFSMKDPSPDPSAVKFLLNELKMVKLPFHVIFNKVDLVDPEVISQWESLLLSWGGYPVSFVSLHNQLGLSDLGDILSGKSSLLLGFHNVGKTSLVQYVTNNRPNEAKYEVCTVLKKANRWLTKKCDAHHVLKEDETTSLRPYCIDLYKDTKSRNSALLVRPKGWIVKRLLETDPPILDDMATWVSRNEKAEEYLYFTKYSPEDECTWWRDLCGTNKEVGLILEKDLHHREVLHQVVVKIYKACFEPLIEHEKMLQILLKNINASPRLCRNLAHESNFLASMVVLMLVGQEQLKITSSHILCALATHYSCKVLIGQLAGFHALSEMIKFGSLNARQAAVHAVSVLAEAEENWSKLLMTGLPEVIVGVLVQDGEDAIPIVSKIFSQLGSFGLAWKRFFNSAYETLNSPQCSHLYNAVMRALLRIKHTEDLKIEFLEGSTYCERDCNSLEVSGA